MDLFWQINWEEMLGDLMVTTFLILLAASIVVVCLMVMFPLMISPLRRRLRPFRDLPKLKLGNMTA